MAKKAFHFSNAHAQGASRGSGISQDLAHCMERRAIMSNNSQKSGKMVRKILEDKAPSSNLGGTSNFESHPLNQMNRT
jgi:hypothetical protein